MSICVISIPSEDRALIAVDTVITHAGGKHSEGVKMHLLPHAGVVLAGVGSVALSNAAFRLASRPAVNPSFDLVARWLRNGLDSILADVLASCADDPQSAAVVGGGSHIYLLGWSQAEARMRGLVFIQDAGARHFREYDTSSRWAQPHDPDYEGSQPQTVDEIAERAASAVRFGRSLDSTCGYGGRIVAAELGPDRITTFVRDLQPDLKRHDHDDPNA